LVAERRPGEIKRASTRTLATKPVTSNMEIPT
jgi:hypothetical protein